MGIKNLNRFLLDNCTTRSIRKMHLSELSGKIIAIDTSIYLYKYIEKEALIENLYLMVSKLLYYGIIPVFIFDGKPPSEKKELIEKRKKDKKIAEEKYNELKEKMDSIPREEMDEKYMTEIKNELDSLKKQFVRIKDTDFNLSKTLLDSIGIRYFEPEGEADHLCAYLVKHNYAWACMSDDMDMFLYGCPRVLRHMSLVKDCVIYYDTNLMLKELDMTHTDFKSILILSGTDYNIGDNNPHLYDVVDMYSDYRKWLDCQYLAGKKSLLSGKNISSSNYPVYINDVRRLIIERKDEDISFIDWLIVENYFSVDKEKVGKISLMFDLSVFAVTHSEELKEVIKLYPFRLKRGNDEVLWKLLQDDGFIAV